MGKNEFKDNLKQLISLKKSAMKRFPFNPKQVGAVEREDVGNWQRGGAKEERARIPAISGNARERALHKLSAATKIRRGENGEREFLLHRGASDEEHAESIKYGYALQNSHSSWTPDYNVALRFASKYGNANKPAKHNVMSAWVPESQIHHIPKQLGSIPGGGPNYFREEYEVIVKPYHGSKLAHEDDLKDVEGRPAETLQDRLIRKYYKVDPLASSTTLEKSDDKETVNTHFDAYAKLHQEHMNNPGSDWQEMRKRTKPHIEALSSIINSPNVSDDTLKHIINKAKEWPTLGRLHVEIGYNLFGKGVQRSQDVVTHALKNDPNGHFLYHIAENQKIPLDLLNHRLQSGGAHVGSILKNLDKFHLYDPETKDDPDTMKTFVNASRMASEFDWKGLLSRFDVRPEVFEALNSTIKEGNHGKHVEFAASHPSMPQHILKEWIQDPPKSKYYWGPDFKDIALRNIRDEGTLRHYASDPKLIAKNPHVPQDIVQGWAESGDLDKLKILAESPASKSNHLHDAVKTLREMRSANEVDLPTYNNLMAKISIHPSADRHLIEKMIGSVHESFAPTLQGQLQYLDPDKFHEKPGKHEKRDAPPIRYVEIHPDIDKIKRIKGVLMEKGTPFVKKSELEKMGIVNLPVEILDPKGNITLAALERYEESLPKERYNVSYGEWNMRSTDPEGDGNGFYPQMHDLTKDQTVINITPSTKQIEEMRSKGLYDTFRDLQEIVRKGSVHPLHSNSIGWARIDDTKPGHWHIDEIQTDLPDIIKMIKKSHGAGSFSGPPELRDKVANIKPEQADAILKILAGRHQDIEHVIHSAVHEIGRKHGIDSISMDSSEDQAEHAGLNTSKTLPSKHKKIYVERPKRAGYYHVPKEEIFGKAPHPNEIHRRAMELWPEDEVDDDGRPLVTPRWLDEVKGPQWNENSKIQFMKLVKSLYRSQAQLLRKGSVRRLYGKWQPHDTAVRDTTGKWTQFGTPEARTQLAARNPGDAERARQLNKLAARTQMRRNPVNGKREFLLHRGVSPDEFMNTNRHDHVYYDQPSSWTPHYNIAHAFALEYQDHPTATSLEDAHKRIHSAWISEDRIKTVPGQWLGHRDPKFGEEHEVIVEPHTSDKAHELDVKAARGQIPTLDMPLAQRRSLKKSEAAKAGKIADRREDKKPRIATFDITHKGTPKSENLGNNLYHHHVQRGNIHYHTITNGPDPFRAGVVSAAAVGQTGKDYKLLDLAVAKKKQGFGNLMVNRLKDFHKSHDMDIARATAMDHSYKEWADYHPDLFNGLMVGYPIKRIDEGISGAVLLGHRLDRPSVIVKPSMRDSHHLKGLSQDIKHEHFKDPNFTTAHREALYHLLADKFFKLGDYVPRTTVFKHPFTEQAHSAMEYIKSAKKYRTPSQLEAVKNPEDLHKLAIMDFILGNNDRHQGNIIFTKDGDIRLIDHGMTFDYGKAFSAEIPVYATRLYDDEVQVPKNVHKWLRGLDETELLKYLSHRGVPETIVSYALAKLEAAKKWSRYARGRGNTLKKLMGNLKQAHPPVSKTQVIDRISDLADTKIADPKKGSKND